MSSIQDKCYHVVCAIPVVQTVVGGAFAFKDLIGIIKDIAMTYIFTDYEVNVQKKISDLQKIIVMVEGLHDQNKFFFDLGLRGNDEVKKKAVEGMKLIQDRLRGMDLFFASDLIDKSKSDIFVENSNTNVYIHQAVIHCRNQKSSLNTYLFFAEAVPAKTRLSNLATNIISMIPTYRIGTIYNLATLGYHCFVKA